MSLGTREDKVGNEAEPEELPVFFSVKCAASDRRLPSDKCAILSLGRMAFFYRAPLKNMFLAIATSEIRTA